MAFWNAAMATTAGDASDSSDGEMGLRLVSSFPLVSRDVPVMLLLGGRGGGGGCEKSERDNPALSRLSL